MAETRSSATPASGVLSSADGSPVVEVVPRAQRRPGEEPVRATDAEAVVIDDHAQAPIRWPKPQRSDVGLALVWLIGLAVALAVPALIVGPSETDVSTAAIWTAFSVTVLGAAIMLVPAGLWYLRTKDPAALMFGAVPALSCVFGGVILAATKVGMN